jgi:copper(I)-binding protein
MLLFVPFLAASEVADWVDMDGAYARAVPPGQPNSAVFMAITNRAEVDHALTGAASDAAGVVELHTHALVDGMMQMRRVERIDLPAHETVRLAPGGLHIMLIDLRRPLQPGERIEMELTFDDGGIARVAAPVQSIESSLTAPADHRP